jgi:hypothetical protein
MGHRHVDAITTQAEDNFQEKDHSYVRSHPQVRHVIIVATEKLLIVLFAFTRYPVIAVVNVGCTR